VKFYLRRFLLFLYHEVAELALSWAVRAAQDKKGHERRGLGCILLGTWDDKMKILDEALNWMANFIWAKMRLLGRDLRAASSGGCW